ncbi:MAG TPA: DUF885 domain-containing protein [Chloroflexota bacterium]|nr:DUF885 domain-containing protein [Chloroflexota bacterium]
MSAPRNTAQDAGSALARLADEFWEAYLAAHPVHATSIGDRRYDDRLEDITPAGHARWRAQLQQVLERARAIPQDALHGQDRLTHSALITEVEGQLAKLEVRLDEWTVDPLNGPQVSLFNIESFQPLRSAREAQAMVARWRAMGPYLDHHVANLERGLAAGKVAVREVVEKVIAAMEGVLATPVQSWALLNPLKVQHPDWPAAQRAAFERDLTAAVQESARPAYLRYLRFLQDKVRPRARPQERAGLLHVQAGPAGYRRLIRVYTSLPLTADQVHEIGQREVQRIDQELEALGERVLGTADGAEIRRRLRHDPALYFTTRDEVQAKAEQALARAKAAIPGWFGVLPRADCVVARIEAHEEQHTTLGYYRRPPADGSLPGRYYINTYAPQTRPRYEAEALAYHESIPGHHLQIAIAQELEGLPAFRRHTGATAFVEGWALYTERLADEMGLYSGDLDRIGVLSFDAWRACRLVVDTGMHAKGWSRRQAIDFMLAHTVLAEHNIVNEVDRYIVWPGQALAYKIGQLEIQRLRADAERRLGTRFDVKRFHDAVLGNGALALQPLRQAVETATAAPPRV